MRIFVPTSNNYIKYVEILKYSIDKYWSNDLDVTVLGYKAPDFDLGNWKFHSFGEQKIPQDFSNDLFDYFSKIEDDYFIYLNDDGVLIDYANLELLDILISCLKYSVGRISLSADLEHRTTPNGDIGWKFYDEIKDFNIIVLKQNANYRISTQFSIWNRKYFIKYLEPNLSPWDFEILQSEKSINDGYAILGSKDTYVLYFSHLYTGGRFGKGSINIDWSLDCYRNKKMRIEDYNYIKNKIF